MTVKLTSEEIGALKDCLPLGLEREVLTQISKDLSIDINGMSDVEAHSLLKKNALILRSEFDKYVNKKMSPSTFLEIPNLSKEELSDLDAQITLILFELSN